MKTDQLLYADGASPGPLLSLTLTRDLSVRESALPGAVSPAVLEADVYAETLPITRGAALDYYRDGEKLGRFYCQDCSCVGYRRFRIVAADAMVHFGKSVSGWLLGHSWPATVQTLLEDMCYNCGVALAPDQTLPDGDLSVEAFEGDNITGTQILAWIGQVTGRYFYVNEQEQLVAGWYAQTDTALGGDVALVQLSDGVLADCWQRPFALRTAVPYQLGMLRYGLFETMAVDAVEIFTDTYPQGVSWPDSLSGKNRILVLRDNPLLACQSHGQLQNIAWRLYTQLSALHYTPLRCTLIPGHELEAGSRVRFSDPGGVQRVGLVTKTQWKNGCCTIHAQGDTGDIHSRLHKVSALENLLSCLQSAQGINRGMELTRFSENFALAPEDGA